MPTTIGTRDLAVESRGVPAVRSRNDPRAERTRLMIFQAVETILAGRPAGVSVGDIVRTAGISRSSFYVHFANLGELTASYLRQQFAVSLPDPALPPRGVPVVSAVRDDYRLLVDRLLEDAPLYSSVLELPVARSAFEALIHEHTDRLIAALRDRVDAPAGVPVHLVSDYVAGGTLSLVDGWRRGRLEVSDDELVDALVALLPGWLLALPAHTPSTPAG